LQQIKNRKRADRKPFNLLLYNNFDLKSQTNSQQYHLKLKILILINLIKFLIFKNALFKKVNQYINLLVT